MLRYDGVHWENVQKWYTTSCSPWWPWFFYHIYWLFYYNVCLIFTPVEFHVCQPVSSYRLWEWFKLLTFYTVLDSHILVFHIEWLESITMASELELRKVNEGIGLILVIQTFHPSALSVLCSLRYLPNLLLYDPLLFLYLFLNYILYYISHHHILATLNALLYYCYYNLGIIHLLDLYILSLLSTCWSPLYLLLLVL